MDQAQLYIGVMSGTSLDGIDTAVVQFHHGHTRLIACDDYPIPADIKAKILQISLGQQTNLMQIGILDHQLGHLFADAVLQLLRKNGIAPEEISAIGNHGQTVYHQPTGDTPFTIQLGDANIIAAKTGITTIADFRRMDMALGGQGAPLVPAFHQSVFKPSDSTVVVLNIGGIANISVLRPNQATIGYDTGPGNMLMDIWIGKQQGRKYDKNAAYAYSGKCIPELLGELCRDSYFATPPPKSTGRELFNLPWLIEKLDKFEKHFQPQDIQATLAEFTSVTIADEVERYRLGDNPELLVCGGGCKNPYIMRRLTQLLPNWSVCTTDEKEIISDYMEAIAFAWLAYRRDHKLPSNLPEVTGASKAVSLGVIYPAGEQEHSND